MFFFRPPEAFMEDRSPQATEFYKALYQYYQYWYHY